MPYTIGREKNMSRTEMKEKERDKSKSTVNLGQSLDNVRNQLMIYGNQIREYLGKMDAQVEGYKFSVEKTDGGLLIDCQFKATIRK
jgi:hypothetical protein